MKKKKRDSELMKTPVCEWSMKKKTETEKLRCNKRSSANNRTLGDTLIKELYVYISA